MKASAGTGICPGALQDGLVRIRMSLRVGCAGTRRLGAAATMSAAYLASRSRAVQSATQSGSRTSLNRRQPAAVRVAAKVYFAPTCQSGEGFAMARTCVAMRLARTDAVSVSPSRSTTTLVITCWVCSQAESCSVE